MKKCFFLLSFLLVIIQLNAQNEKRDHSLVVEVLPFMHKFSYGNGLQLNYQIEKNRFCHAFSMGFYYSDYQAGHSQFISNFNDDPARWSTTVDYEVDEDFPYFYENTFIGTTDYEILQNYGFSNLKPRLDYRLHRYLTYEFLGKIIQNKINLYFGIGLSLGLANTSYTIYSMDGFIVKDDKNQLVEDYWVRFSVRAKYLYLAPTSKIVLDIPINEKLDLGFSGGLHYMLDREFKGEIYSLYYLGLRAKIKL
jgi:hypothetical protein